MGQVTGRTICELVRWKRRVNFRGRRAKVERGLRFPLIPNLEIGCRKIADGLAADPRQWREGGRGVAHKGGIQPERGKAEYKAMQIAVLCSGASSRLYRAMC